MDSTTLRAEMAVELERILAFWMEHSVDKEHGGFYGELDNQNRVQPDSDKSAILNARILWTFASALRTTKCEQYRAIADRAFAYLSERFVDPEHGGVFWSLNSDGSMANGRKQLYAIAFAIYGCSEYFGATGKPEALALAKDLYQSIEAHGFDAERGGYVEAFARDWGTLDDLRLSDKDENAPKTMNTHLHILEAYANLLRYWQDEGLERQLRSLIVVSLEKIVQDDFHFGLFFDLEWNPTNRNVSFGHDIEGSWLLHEAAEVLGDPSLLERVKAVAIRMAEVTLHQGIAPQGGIREELQFGKGVQDLTFHWWPQAEGVVGFYNAYQLTAQTHYLDMATRLWRFVREYFRDLEYGEWFWRVDMDGKPIKDTYKIGFWKCPYHNGRACMEILNRIIDSKSSLERDQVLRSE